jgi:nitrate reductase NapE component
MIPIVLYADLISARRMRLNPENGLYRRCFHIFLFAAVLAVIGLISREEAMRGVGPWVAINENPGLWMLPTVIQGYVDFAKLAFNSLTMGAYHVVYTALSKLPNLSQEFSSDESRATEITTQVMLVLSLTPFLATAVVMARKLVLLIRLKMAYNPLLERELVSSYRESVWLKLEVLVVSAIAGMFRSTITISAAMFAGLVAAPLLRDSMAAVAVMVGAYSVFRIWLKIRRSQKVMFR